MICCGGPVISGKSRCGLGRTGNDVIDWIFRRSSQCFEQGFNLLFEDQLCCGEGSSYVPYSKIRYSRDKRRFDTYHAMKQPKVTALFLGLKCLGRI